MCLAVALAAVAVGVAVGAAQDGRAIAHPFTLLCITVLLSYTHVRATRVVYKGQVVATQLDEALFVPMVLLLGPIEVTLAVAVASLVGNLAARRTPTKLLFNVGQNVLSFLIGYGIARLGGAEVGAPITAVALTAATIGGLAVAASSNIAVALIVRLATGRPIASGLRRQVTARGAHSFGGLFLGVLAGVAVRAHPVTAIPAVGVGLMAERAYVMVTIQRHARLAAEALQDLVVAIRNSTDADDIRVQVLAAAPRIVPAQAVRLVEAGEPEAPHALRAAISDHVELEVSERIGGDHWHEEERSALDTLATVASAALRNAQLLTHLSAITDSQRESVLTIDAAGVITFANPAARRLIRCAEPLGRPAADVFTMTRDEGAVDLSALVGADGGLVDNDATLVAGRGERVPVAFTATPLTTAQTGAVLVIHEITERKAFEEKLTYLAFHDPLTHLPNRRLFEDRLDHALARAERLPTRHALLMIDLDRFKLVNDSYGHPVGDSLLIKVAAQLRRTLRREDTCARIGGDEFAILLEDITDVAYAVDVAQRILATLAEGSTVDGHEVFVSASIGIATTDQASTRDALIAAADTAAYLAKEGGKGQHQVFTPETAANPRARLELERALRRALENGELEVYYQPLVDTVTREAIGAEALVRWNSPDGLVEPARFIPLAEETGLIVPLGAWVLEEACRQAHEWTLARPELPPIEIGVNLSAHQLSRATFVEEVDAVLRRTGLRPEQLCLEITETVIMRDTKASIATLQRLKELGVQLAIDDFGTGYSSLSYLKQFPVDVVKIDRAFLAGLGESAVDTEIVTAVIRLTAACGMTAVAEGVETEENRLLLEEMGCPMIQGYLISRPVRASAFAAFWYDNTSPLVPVQR
ncbi:putative bifunctional diguanylate cyclase/phosphodiesterase [Nocardioides nematodiphilus]|uniref:putative bifunctional diguanylate cyclase/phosphodiesterase n=1 Tax=Nocardioides nematodiphilus TaxID=2849669 RepID=UPI001CDA4071|nr:GGDEF domain-containing phosphodiesterase [Nocardioides nematodiphilus]MCA1983371.1 EAL domain-containing protein [Nocardioides nematodiphilus]